MAATTQTSHITFEFFTAEGARDGAPLVTGSREEVAELVEYYTSRGRAFRAVASDGEVLADTRRAVPAQFELVYRCDGWSCTTTHATKTAAEELIQQRLWGTAWVRTVGGRNWIYRHCTGLDCTGYPHSDGSHSHRVGIYEIRPLTTQAQTD